MFLKQIFARGAKEGKYAIFKNSNYQTDISEIFPRYFRPPKIPGRIAVFRENFSRKQAGFVENKQMKLY